MSAVNDSLSALIQSEGFFQVYHRDERLRSAFTIIALVLCQPIINGRDGSRLTVTEAGKITKEVDVVLKNVANEMGILPGDGKSQVLHLLCHIFPYLAWERKGIQTKSGGTHYEVEFRFRDSFFSRATGSF